MKKEKKIPTILGLFFLVASIAAGVYLSSSKVGFQSKASGDCKPTNIQTTNITHNSFTLSFTTSAICPSSVSINGRTISNFTQSSKIHYFTADDLKENNEYRFLIISNGIKYEEASYLIKTAKKPSGIPPTSDIAWGKIYNPDMSPGAYSLVYIIIPSASPLSALATGKGNWNIPFANSYNPEKNNWFTPQANIQEDIYVISQDNQTTQIAGNTSRNNPVPDIVIGQNTFSSETVDSGSAGKLDLSTDNSSLGKITILNPKEGEIISTLRPDFFGTADPNHTLTVDLQGPISASGRPLSDSVGMWHWSPTSNLIPGNYIIKAGTVQHNFSVSAEIGSLAYTASNSAGLQKSPTSTPILSPTQISVLSPTSIPVLSSTPVLTTIPTQTSSITPTPRTYKPSTDSGVPTTGNSLPTLILGILSLSLIVFGVLLI